MLAPKAHKRTHARRSGFTLLEILVVVGIIVALAGLGIVYLLPQSEKAEEDAARVKIKKIEEACEMYRQHYKEWPQTLDALFVKGELGGPYLKDKQQALIDPWNKPIGYNPNGQDPETGVDRPRIFIQHPKHSHIANY